ncbi:MAG: T9SS type B sorting domain-containing protein [Bacteroidetes bacterium]|nr:T9SS type B sorting domain-containing protein [Bacteroidota bacterium]
MLTIFLLLSPNQSFAQDECDNAILLTELDNWCSPAATYSNTTATSSLYGAPGCWPGALQDDVWFKFVAIAPNVSIKIYGQEYSLGTMRRPRVALYSGTCGGTINELGCEVSAAGDLFTPAEHFVELYKNGLAVGQTYYIRVDALNGGGFNGTFALCINNFLSPSVAGQDCSTALQLCSTDAISFQFNGGAGTENDEANNTCLDDYNSIPGQPFSESNSTWLVWECGTSGTLDFVLIPTNSSDDLDFALYELPNGINNCNGKQLLRCMASSCTQGGGTAFTGLVSSETDNIENPGCIFPDNNFVDDIDMTAGTAYGLLINNFSSTSASNGFLLQFGGTGVGGTGGFTDLEASFDIARDCDGDEVVFTDNSTNAVSYEWNFGIGANIETSTGVGPHTVMYPPGSYTAVLTITDAGGCQDLDYIAFDIPQESLTYDAVISDVSCGASNDGSITINVTNGTGPYQYSNDGGSTYSAVTADAFYTFSGLTADSYDIVLLNALGCQQTSTEVVSGGAGNTSISNISTIAEDCNATNGSITVTITASDPSYQYSNDGGSTFSAGTAATSYTFNGLADGSYDIVVMDNSGCTVAQNGVNVAEQNTLSISGTTPSDATCGNSNGSVMVDVTGGNGPYQYSSDNGATFSAPQASPTFTFNNLPANSYTIVVMDANGCTQSTSETINNTSGVSITSVTPNNAICNAADGSIAVVISGGTSPYQYSSDGGSTYTSTQASTTYTFTGLSGGAYNISVLDAASCTDNQAANVGITEMPVTSTINDSICFGDSIQYGNVYYASAGSYPDSLLAFNGCDSIVTVNISLLPYPTGQLNTTICSGGSYTMPLGEVVTSPGSYVDTIPAFECDSIVTVIVSVDAFTQGNENVSLCPGESYTMPLGEVVSSTGSHIDTIPGTTCDSVVTINIFNHSYGMGVDAVAICPGESHTLPSGTVVSTGGVYLDTIPGFSCDSIISVAVTALMYANGFETATICEGDTYTMPAGEIVSTDGIYVDTIPGFGCDSIVTVSLTVLPYASGSENVSLCEGESYFMPSGEAVTSSGTYTDTIPGSFCDSIITVIVNINPLPSNTVATTICATDSATIDGQTWYNTTGSFTDTIPGSQCDSIVTLDLTVETPPSSSPAFNICEGDSITINGTDYFSTTGVYSDTLSSTGCDSVITLILTVTPYSTGSRVLGLCTGDSATINGSDYFTVTGIYSDTIPGFRCDSVATLDLTISDQSLNTLNKTICDGDSSSINGVDYFYTTDIYTDTLVGFQCDSVVVLNLTVIIPADITLTQTICEGESATINDIDFYTTSGTYTDTLDGWHCDSFVTLILTVNELTIDNIGTANVNCNGDDGQVSITHSGSAGSVTYAITDNNSNTSTHTTSVIDLGAGDYTVVLIDSIGCTSHGSFTIGRDSLEGFDLTPASSSIFLGESIILEANPAIGEFTWSPPFFLSCDTCAVVTASPEYSLQYILYNDRAGCITSDTAWVEVRQPETFIPTAFSPNGDNNNDVLMVLDKNVDELVFFRIYNRWGELLFETSDINEGWDGLFNAEKQEMDTYIYHILTILYTGQPFEISGEVLLLR